MSGEANYRNESALSGTSEKAPITAYELQLLERKIMLEMQK